MIEKEKEKEPIVEEAVVPTEEPAGEPAVEEVGEPAGETESVQEDTAEGNVEESPKVHALIAKFRSEFPDKSDDELLDMALEEIEGGRDYKNRNELTMQKVRDVFEAYPQLVHIFQQLTAGADFDEVIARNVDLDGLQKQEGDPDWEKWDANKKARAAEREANSKLDQELDANIEASTADLKEFAEENNMSPEAAIEWVNTHVAPILDNIAKLRISKATLQMIQNAITKDDAVKEAEQVGVVKGRNEQIETLKVDAKKTDGIPSLGGSATPEGQDKKPPKKSYIDTLMGR